MKSLTLTPTLFGVDLRRLGQDWAQALALMAQWPGVRWLSPQYAIRLSLPEGGWITCTEKNGRTRVVQDTLQTPFSGLVLPEELVLWRNLQLPSLKGTEFDDAVQLEVDRLNPFEAEDLLWTSTLPVQHGDAGQQLQIVLTSRRLVAEYLASHAAKNPAQGAVKPAMQAEVWARQPDSDQYVIFAGFGESARQQRTRYWRFINLLLVALIVMVGVAAAVTPSLQLRYRVQQAWSDFTQLQSKSAKAVATREQMTQLNNKVQQLQALVGARMVPEYVLFLLSKYIPDDTYILVLDIKESTVNITGVTTNATALMQHLGKQPGVKKVTAPNAARRERDKEVFNIEFVLEPQPDEATAPKAPASAGGKP